jgi:hypothetical protein
MTNTSTHALRFVAFGSQSGGICACGWNSEWHRTDQYVAEEYEWHVTAAHVDAEVSA